MHARVATFDYTGSDPEDVRRGFEEIKRRAAAGFTDELPALELLDLYNPNDAAVLSITLFETEEDLRKGDATLSSMAPPKSGAVGRRVSVQMYEVPVKIDGSVSTAG
ncbi:MAG: hypothetical protein M3071_23610 [Actinomycetota bacterium]|nr:hypothetical protein [Actinomycetota bacterium]